MMHRRSLMLAAGGAEPVGVDFDGTNDYLSRSSDLVGNTDSKTFTFSCWVYGTVNKQIVFGQRDGSTANEINLGSSGNIEFENSAGTRILRAQFTGIPTNTWGHVVCSIDMANTSNRSVYVNDEAVSVTWTTYTNDTIDFTTPEWKLAYEIGTNSPQELRLAGVYLDHTYRDLSVEANRRDFIDADGLYVTPPTSGIISVPMDDPDDVGRNDGTGGDFTLNGTVARSGRGPNQYNAVASTFDGVGNGDYLQRGTLGASDGKQITISAFFRFDEVSNGEAVLFFYNASNYNNQIVISMPTAGQLSIKGQSVADGQSFHVGGAFGLVDGAGIGLYINVSANCETGDIHVYVNGKEASGLFSYVAANNVNIPFSILDTNRIGRSDSTNGFKGQIGEVYVTNEYIDLSTENPFYDVDTNKPKYLGESGELPTGSSPLIYLPLRADDAGNNLGTGGDFTVNSGPYVGARGASEFLARSADFDGSTGYLSTGAALTGISDGKTFSIVVNFEMLASRKQPMLYITDVAAGGSLMLQFERNASNVFVCSAMSAAKSDVLRFEFTETSTAWKNCMISIDLANTSNRNVLIDGVSQSVTWTVYSDTAIGFTEADDVDIGDTFNSGDFLDGSIGGLYFTTDYIDFSQEANRLKFMDAFGYPVDLQPAIDAGDIPTPLIHMKFDDPDALGANSGSGGDFTVTGTVTSGSDVKG
jgi:hypothetical protein